MIIIFANTFCVHVCPLSASLCMLGQVRYLHEPRPTRAVVVFLPSVHGRVVFKLFHYENALVADPCNLLVNSQLGLNSEYIHMYVFSYTLKTLTIPHTLLHPFTQCFANINIILYTIINLLNVFRELKTQLQTHQICYSNDKGIKQKMS
jgi:hypothetical protein